MVAAKLAIRLSVIAGLLSACGNDTNNYYGGDGTGPTAAPAGKCQTWCEKEYHCYGEDGSLESHLPPCVSGCQDGWILGANPGAVLDCAYRSTCDGFKTCVTENFVKGD